MRTFRYVVADVFTDTPLAGNALAVFTDGRGLGEDEMQRLARETNLSESVFVLPPEAGGDARIRIFTPSVELPFAGHPTLGSAFVLAGPLQLPEIRLEASELPVEHYDNGAQFVYVGLGSEDEVATLRPEPGALSDLPGFVGVLCFAGSGARWKARMFAPGGGIVEDPATGSAAGPLAVHLARHGRIAFGDEIEITQGVEIGRPSKLFARAVGTAEELERVEVGGSAVVVARGEFRLP